MGTSGFIHRTRSVIGQAASGNRAAFSFSRVLSRLAVSAVSRVSAAIWWMMSKGGLKSGTTVSCPDFAKIRADSLDSADDREGGEYFKRQLLRARYGNPDIIFISGWNDWQYANHIEPAVGYGYQYVDLAASLLGRSAETAPYRTG